LGQIGYELLNDVKPDGTPVYDWNDDPHIIARDILHHTASRLIAVTGFIERYVGTHDTPSAYKALRKDIGNLWGHFLEATTLAYLRRPENLRKASAVRNLRREFKYWLTTRNPPKSTEELLMRVRNFTNRVKDILEIEEEKTKAEDFLEQ